MKHIEVLLDYNKLFRERKADLNQIKRRLAECSIITISGNWGSGKTFLMNYLRQDLNDKYYFINIKTLTYDIDELEEYIIDELDSILNKDRVFVIPDLANNRFKSSNMLINFFIRVLFPGRNTQTSAIRNFAKDIGKLTKPVVIVFEDIDRLNEWKSINKVFSLADDLVRNTTNSRKIKIIYECLADNINRIAKKSNCLNEDEDYVEKYLPNQINLTHIGLYETIVNILTIVKNHENININDFSFIYLYNFTLKNHNYAIDLSKFNSEENAKIRKVERFLDELNSKFYDYPNLRNQEDRKIVIVHFFVKYFLTDFYNKISGNSREMLEIFQIKGSDAGNNTTFLTDEILQKELDENDAQSFMNNILIKGDNCLMLWLLSIIGYNFYANYDVKLDPKHANKNKFNEDIKDITNRYRNHRIAVLFMHLYQQGKPQNTNEEQAVINLEKDVLNFPETEWKRKYEEYCSKYYKGMYDSISGNRTIFLMGISYSYSLFRAMYLASDTVLKDPIITWKRFMKFYFDYYDEQENIIDLNLISNLCFCPVDRSKSLYLYVLAKFNEMRIIGYLDDNEAYLRFVYEYLQCLYMHGFINDNPAHDLRNMWQDKSKKKDFYDAIIENTVNIIKRIIDKQYKEEHMPEILSDIEVITKFLDKILEIGKCDNAALVKETEIKVNTKSYGRNKDNYDKILTYLKDHPQDAKKILADKYKFGELSAFDVLQIQKELQEKGT